MQMELDKIYNVDCLDGMKDISDGSIDMIFCDLPYGMTRNAWDCVIDPVRLWEQYERIIKPNGAILLFGQDKFTARMMLSNEKLHRYNIIWEKQISTGFLNAKRMPLRIHEDIMVFYKKPPVYNPQMVKGKPSHSRGKAQGVNAEDIVKNRIYGSYTIAHDRADSDMKYPTSVWSFARPHPSVAISSTEKPIELCRYAIRTYTNPGDVVLDNCCGCGSIPIAAKMEGRHYIGMDNGTCDNTKSEYNGMSWADVTTLRLRRLDEKEEAA